MVLHGPSGSMQFLVKGTRQMLLDLMDWHILNSVIDLQISLFDVELCWVILMTFFPELGQSRKLSYITINYICVDFLPSKRWVRCAVFAVYHMPYRTKVLHGYQENSTVWQDARRLHPPVQDKPQTEDSMRSISRKSCDASKWYGMEWRGMDSD